MPARSAKPRARAQLPAAPLPMRSFSSSLPMALLRAREAVMRRFRPGLRHHGVTEQQWRVLRALAGHTALEISELASVTCLLLPSLSRILPQLQSRGLIARQPVPGDLRRATLKLTAEGMELIAAHAPQSEAIYRGIEQRFGGERLTELFELLQQLERTLTRGPERAGSARAARAHAAEVRKS